VVDRQPPRLLRGHVRRRPEHHPGLGGQLVRGRRLVAAGRGAATPALIVENASLANERRVATTLAGLAAAAAGLDAQAVATAQVEAAAQHCDHEVWFEAFDEAGVPVDWQVLADEWESVADHVVERVSTAVTDNLGSLATEIRETGELGGLLAKAAAGKTLSAAEKRKVKAQLIDLAKAVPALAIFAAPGGMLLLPLLAKLLPFSVLPSAWDEKEKATPRARKKLEG
jgi:hypothetical protein